MPHSSHRPARRRDASWVQVLTHPVVVLSLVALVVNDHWAKHTFGNAVTGKLSDATGSLLLAALLALGWATTQAWIRSGTPRPAAVTPTAALVSAAVVVAGVTVAKTSAAGATVAAWVLGATRWPTDVASAAITGGAPAWVQPVSVVVDAGDVGAALFAFCLVGVVHQARPPGPDRQLLGANTRDDAQASEPVHPVT